MRRREFLIAAACLPVAARVIPAASAEQVTTVCVADEYVNAVVGRALSYSDMERLETMLKFRMIETPPRKPWPGRNLDFPRLTGRAL